MNWKKKVFVASVLGLVLSVNLFAQESYTIENKTLKEALEIISKKSNLSYITDDKLLESKKINNIQNVEGLENALELMLKGTGLKAIVKKDAIVIVKKGAKSTRNSLEADLGAVDIVSASRLNLSVDESPATIKIITKEEIEQQLKISSNASDVLGSMLASYSPSRQKMNGNGETIRGRRPLFLIDGVPQSNPLRPTGREVHTIDFSMVERIEIINGPSATNGIAGVGGVVNIITKKPQEDKVSQTIDIQTTIPTSKLKGETSSYKVGYTLGGKEEDLDYFFSGSYEDQGLYVDGNGDAVAADNTQGDLMDSKTYDIMSKFGYWIDDNQNINLTVNKYNIENDNNYVTVSGDKDAGVLATSQKGTPNGNAPYNDTLTLNVAYENSDFYDMHLSAMVYNQNYEGLFGATNSSSFQDVSIAPVGTLYDQTRVKSTKYGSKISLNKEGLFENKLNLTFGLDTMFDESFQDLYLTNRTYVPKSNYNVFSPFVLGAFDLTDNLTLHGGVRHETGEIDVESYTTVARYNSVDVQGGSIDIDETLFNTGLVYDFGNNMNVFASYSEGFTLPDVGRALRSINTPGVNLSNFKNLEPIITDSYEIGFRGQKGIFDFEVALYQNESDFGSRITTNGTGQYILKREKTQVRGLELALGVDVNETNHLNFMYSYSEGKYDSDQDGSLDSKLNGLNIAPNRLLAKWSSKITNNLSTYLQANHAFNRKFDEASRYFSGYTLVDFSSIYKLSPDSTLSLGIANLFDKQYVTYYSQSAVDDDSRYSAGRGRTVTLGYSLKF